MTDPGPFDPGPVGSDPFADLRRATEQLRGRVHPRAVAVQDDVLARALRASRTSVSLRARAPYDFVRVSDRVLVAELRRRIDGLSPSAAVGRVYLRLHPDRTLRTVTVELFVQYGTVIMDLADRVRLGVAEVLQQTLGSTSADVDLVLADVHVSDVTVGSPHLVDPGEEPT